MGRLARETTNLRRRLLDHAACCLDAARNAEAADLDRGGKPARFRRRRPDPYGPLTGVRGHTFLVFPVKNRNYGILCTVAFVAQWIESLTSNQKIGGSNPSGGA